MLTALPSLVLFAISMSGTPGPNNIMVTASAATFGFRRTMPHVLGISAGFPLMVLLVGLGLGSLFIADPRIHVVMKYAGAIYMLWLAARIATARRPTARAPGRSRPLTFIEAALFQWVNPKAWIIAAAAIGTYASLHGDLWVESAVIALIFAIVTLPVVACWSGVGARVGAVLRSDLQFRLFNLGMAILLVVSLVSLFYEP
ncbi:MAG: LysE family translocator [Acidiphilium sp.]